MTKTTKLKEGKGKKKETLVKGPVIIPCALHVANTPHTTCSMRPIGILLWEVVIQKNCYYRFTYNSSIIPLFSDLMNISEYHKTSIAA